MRIAHACGARRIKEASGKSGVKVSRQKVRRSLAEENLQAIQPKKFKPKTTDSRGTTAAPNLLAEIKSEECASAEIIIGGITYIRLQGGTFCYLAV